jgi:hypothetical protein
VTAIPDYLKTRYGLDVKRDPEIADALSLADWIAGPDAEAARERFLVRLALRDLRREAASIKIQLEALHDAPTDTAMKARVRPQLRRNITSQFGLKAELVREGRPDGAKVRELIPRFDASYLRLWEQPTSLSGGQTRKPGLLRAAVFLSILRHRGFTLEEAALSALAHGVTSPRQERGLPGGVIEIRGDLDAARQLIKRYRPQVSYLLADLPTAVGKPKSLERPRKRRG